MGEMRGQSDENGASAMERVETALYEHRLGGLTCYDHPPTSDERWWCCTCGEHRIRVPWRRHVALQVVRDRVLRPTTPAGDADA